MKKHEVEKALQLAKKYWLKIQPIITNRPLRGAELFIATDAYSRLRKAAALAEEWNRTQDGQSCPVPDDEIPDFGNDPFLEPEELCRDERLKPEDLAAIAAPLMQKQRLKLKPLAAVGVAHELLMAAKRYLKSLPEQKRGTDRIIKELGMAFSTITFAEIEASNRENSGQLPLLPPVAKRTGKTLNEPLSSSAIRIAVRKFLKERTPPLMRLQYEREQEQEENLSKAGRLFRASGKPKTHEEWQSDNQKAIDDCMANGRISIQALCGMRWQRFVETSETRKRSALKRTSAKPKLNKKRPEKRPSSAASSPQVAGKREK